MTTYGSTIPNHSAYFAVKAYNTYSRGEKRFHPNGATSRAGFASVIWILLDVDAASYNWLYLYTNYNRDVTIATTTGVDGVYSNWNAYADMPDPSALQENDFGRFGEVPIRMTLVETT
jgi:hypothetical protein